MENEIEKKKFGLTSYQLKWIAIILMFINHLCCCLDEFVHVDNLFVTEIQYYITRPAFVIFAFQIAEGMHYTRNRQKYICNLFIFAMISDIAFDLCFYRTPLYFGYQNVFWTLAFGALSIHLIDQVNKDPFKTSIIALITGMICIYMNTDYGALGTLCIICFYYFRDNKKKQMIHTSMLFIVLSFLIYIGWDMKEGATLVEAITAPGLLKNAICEIHGLLAIPLILLYNGERGKKMNKWFFYIFYPGHLLLLYFLTSFLIK